MPFFKRKTAAAESISKQPSSGSGLVRTPSNRSSRSTASLPQTPNTPDSWGADNDIGYVSTFANGPVRPQTLVLCEDMLDESKDLPPESLESPLRTTSRLSKTLLEVVRDKNALACFKAFMKSQRSDHLIQFWCDAESFHASTLTRLRTHSLHSSCRKRRTESATSVASETSMSKDNVSDTQDSPLVSREASVSDRLSELSVNLATETNSTFRPICTETANVRVDHTVQSQSSEDSGNQSQKQNLNIPLPKSSSETNILSQEAYSPDVPSNTPSSTVPAPALPSFNTHDGGNELQTCTQNTGDVRLPGDGAEASPSLPGPSHDHPDNLSQKLKKSVERDAVTIFSTYIAKDAPKPIGVDDDLRSEAISKICQEDGKVDPECFVNCQRFVLNKMDAEYFQSFKDSAFYCRHQVHVLTTEKVFLPDILLNENALCYFMEYMEQEGASDLMQVWLCASNFQQQLLATTGSYDPGQAQADAMVIYDKYFSLQATNPVGFDDKLRFEVEGNICREEGPLPDCFTKAKNIVLKMLEKTYFPGYLHSQIYHRYLSDLISTVQINEDIPQRSNSSGSGVGLGGSQSFKGHKRSESDASSEHSFSSVSQSGESVSASSSARNTLLAVDTWRVKRGSKKSKINLAADFSMNLDMFNPDDLWKRPQANNLSLGSVNEFGQFVSDFDHETITSERRKASLGPLLFKKSKEKEKEEEEMALRIAQIIIRDVNTMTRTGETMAQKKTS